MSIQFINNICPPHVETSQMHCIANQFIGYFKKGILVINGLIFKQLLEIYSCKGYLLDYSKPSLKIQFGFTNLLSCIDMDYR